MAHLATHPPPLIKISFDKWTCLERQQPMEEQCEQVLEQEICAFLLDLYARFCFSQHFPLSSLYFPLSIKRKEKLCISITFQNFLLRKLRQYLN